MNQARKSAVGQFLSDSIDASMVQSLCARNIADNATERKPGKWANFKKVLDGVSQPCEQMLIWCRYGVEYNCMDLFHSILTDEGKL